MIVKTKFFGEMEVNEDSVYIFENGIPGFLKLHKYIILADESPVINYLQSVEDENICFIVTNPFNIMADYDIEICESTIKMLEIQNTESVMLYVILTIPSEVNAMTANMKAPIVINMQNKRGIQEILDDERYETRYKLMKENDA